MRVCYKATEGRSVQQSVSSAVHCRSCRTEKAKRCVTLYTTLLILKLTNCCLVECVNNKIVLLRCQFNALFSRTTGVTQKGLNPDLF